MSADLDRLRRQIMSLREAEAAANEFEAARDVVKYARRIENDDFYKTGMADLLLAIDVYDDNAAAAE